jgi:hypothetical protein
MGHDRRPSAVQRVELYVGDATRAVPPSRVRDIVTALTAS